LWVRRTVLWSGLTVAHNVRAVGVRCRLWKTKLLLKTKLDMENNTSINHENGNDANRLLANVIVSGSKLVFTDEFKQKIIAHPARDVMYYIKDDVFEVKEVKDDTVSIKGIALLGFVPISLFNVC